MPQHQLIGVVLFGVAIVDTMLGHLSSRLAFMTRTNARLTRVRVTFTGLGLCIAGLGYCFYRGLVGQ